MLFSSLILFINRELYETKTEISIINSTIFNEYLIIYVWPQTETLSTCLHRKTGLL